MLGRPRFVRVEVDIGGGGRVSEVRDQSVIGPLEEGSPLVMRCSAGGGRPIPEVRKKGRKRHVLN